MYEMRRRKPAPTLLPTPGIFDLPHKIADDSVKCKLYTAGKLTAAQLTVITMTGIRTPVPMVTYPAP